MPSENAKRPSYGVDYPVDPEVDALFGQDFPGCSSGGNQKGEVMNPPSDRSSGEPSPTVEFLAFDQVCAKAKKESDDCAKAIDNPTGSFDEALFGMLLRKLRTDNGYKTAEDLSKALASVTGVSITPQTIYRIEKGTRSLTYPEFLAYSLLFFEEFDSDEMRRYRALCVPKFWEAIDRRTYWDRVTNQL